MFLKAVIEKNKLDLNSKYPIIDHIFWWPEVSLQLDRPSHFFASTFFI
jgi:hypothetical protein